MKDFLPSKDKIWLQRMTQELAENGFWQCRHNGLYFYWLASFAVIWRIKQISNQNNAKYFTQSIMLYVCFFVKWHINLCRLFNAKTIALEEQ